MGGDNRSVWAFGKEGWYVAANSCSQRELNQLIELGYDAELSVKKPEREGNPRKIVDQNAATA